MSRRVQLSISIVAIAVAIGVGFYVHRVFTTMVTTAQIVTPAQPIPVGALIESWMLDPAKEVPRPLLDEDIYVQVEELAGQVAMVPLYPGMVIYRSFAVHSSQYRIVDDPTLEVVSFPVDPARAVGGQLQPGHRVDVWRLASINPDSAITLTTLAESQWATATLLLEQVPVVDVRAATGVAVSRSPQVVPGQVGDRGQQSSSPALQVLTVAVPQGTARDILALVAEERSGIRLWITLAPLVAGEENENGG